MKSIFFYITVSLERTETGVKIAPNKNLVRELETYSKSVYSSTKDKLVIQKINLGEIPEFEYPEDMDIKDIEKDLKEKGILTKINMNKYRLKDSYVEKLQNEIEMDKNVEAAADAAQVTPDELQDMQEAAEEVVANKAIPQNNKVSEAMKKVNKKKKPWIKNRFKKRDMKVDDLAPVVNP